MVSQVISHVAEPPRLTRKFSIVGPRTIGRHRQEFAAEREFAHDIQGRHGVGRADFIRQVADEAGARSGFINVLNEKISLPAAFINYFVLGDQVVMTPLFVGSEPARATSGKYKGTEILQQEQNEGLLMLHSLPAAQQKQAVLNFSKTGNNNLTEAFKDNVVIDYAGLRTHDLAEPVRLVSE